MQRQPRGKGVAARDAMRRTVLWPQRVLINLRTSTTAGCLVLVLLLCSGYDTHAVPARSSYVGGQAVPPLLRPSFLLASWKHLLRSKPTKMQHTNLPRCQVRMDPACNARVLSIRLTLDVRSTYVATQ